MSNQNFQFLKKKNNHKKNNSHKNLKNHQSLPNIKNKEIEISEYLKNNNKDNPLSLNRTTTPNKNSNNNKK
jgi:hypothetical protein